VPTTCHTVFRITELGRGGIAELKKQIETMGLPGFRNERPRVLEELGAVQFRGDETRPFSGDEQVKQQWGARHATAALVVAHGGDEEAGTEALRIVRGEAIADILGGAVTPLPVETRTAPGVDCPVATLVFGVEGEQPPPETVCYEVRGMLADPAGPADIRNALQNKDIATLRTAGNDLGKLVHGGANTVKNLNETDWEVSRRRLLVFAKDMRGFPLADGDEIAHSLGWDQQARPYEVQFEGQAGFPAEATCPFFAFALVDATAEIN
jgi:hypothetical protein